VIVWDGAPRRRAPTWRVLSPYAGFALFVGVILFLVFVVEK
jgi:hypothetical protein